MQSHDEFIVFSHVDIIVNKLLKMCTSSFRVYYSDNIWAFTLDRGIYVVDWSFQGPTRSILRRHFGCRIFGLAVTFYRTNCVSPWMLQLRLMTYLNGKKYKNSSDVGWILQRDWTSRLIMKFSVISVAPSIFGRHGSRIRRTMKLFL